MALKTNLRAEFCAPCIALATLLLLCAGCRSNPKSAEEPSAPHVKWYVHCDACNWCKGSFKSTQEAQELVSSHNKAVHDWYKVAYYDMVKCK